VTELDTSPTEAKRVNLRGRYIQAALYSGIGGAVSQILYGLTPVLLARYLGPRDYGVYSVVMALIGMSVGIISLGQNAVLHKLLPEYSVSDRQRGGGILADTVILTSGIVIIFSAILFASSGWIASTIYRDASLIGLFRFCVLLTLSLSLFNLASSVVAGLQDFKAYNGIMIARSLALVGLTWIGVWHLGLLGALGGQLLAGLLGLVLLTSRGMKLARQRFPGMVRPDFSRSILRILFSFTLPTLLVTILNIPAYWWASTLVAREAGFEEVGLFSVAYSLAQLILLVPMNLYIPAMTFMSEAHAVSQPGEFGKLVSANLRVIWAMTLPLALGAALFSPLIIRLFFGSAYLAASPLAFMMSFTALLMINIGLINTALVAAGHLWPSVAITLSWAVIFAIAGLVCIPRFGAMGAAMVFAVSNAIYLIITYLYSRFALRVPYESLGRLLVLSVLGFATASIITVTFQGFALYAAASLLLLGLIAAEWMWISDSTERERLWRSGVSFLAGWRGNPGF
jgi:O-antigen/teichoic acid export membrane protein